MENHFSEMDLGRHKHSENICTIFVAPGGLPNIVGVCVLNNRCVGPVRRKKGVRKFTSQI